MSIRLGGREATLSGADQETTRRDPLPTYASALLAAPTACLVVIGVPVLALAALWWARAARRVEVEGPSMLPTLAPGERLLVARGPGARLRAGDLVVVHDPEVPERLLVKRVVSLGDAGVVVAGDNAAASRDSRAFGPVARALVVGRAWYRYWPSSEAGRLERTADPGFSPDRR
jgi:nickel-type superoxide dismutase maturation protease